MLGTLNNTPRWTARSSERINTPRALGEGIPEAEALGRSQGSFFTKAHLRVRRLRAHRACPL